MGNGEAVVINLAARYAAAFGMMAINNTINQAVVIKEDNKFQVEVYEDTDPDFEEIEMQYENTVLKFGKMLESEGSFYAPPLMINFEKEKKLIETEISGSDDVVIERWGNKSWVIDIRGVLIDVENRNYPSGKIQQLCRFFDYNNIIKVSGLQFGEKGIDSIYLKYVSITPVEGFQDTIQFTLKASSIREVSWTLLKPNV